MQKLHRTKELGGASAPPSSFVLRANHALYCTRMGYYIETPENLNKAGQLLAAHPAIREVKDQPAFDPTGQTVVVCVVENGPFDACAVAYSPGELDYFQSPDDPRPKRWLVVPRELVVKLCPKVEQRLIPLGV